MVANEWNELQNYRKTSVAAQLMAMAFFLKVLNFQALAIVQPGIHLGRWCTKPTHFSIGAILHELIPLLTR